MTRKTTQQGGGGRGRTGGAGETLIRAELDKR